MEKAEREQHLAIVRSTPDRLKAALTNVPKKLLTWRPAPGKWSIHEIVCHMRDSERLGYLHRYTQILTKDNPTFPDVDGDALALEGQYRRLNLREVLRDWRAARKACLALLRKIKAKEWTRMGSHETAGPMSLETVLQRQALGNDEAHLVQIEHIKKRWEILSKLQETPKAVAAMFRGLSDDEARRRPAPEQWSMLEILCHLRDVEFLFVERYGKIANHDRPTLRMIDQNDLAVRLRYNADDPAAALREFQTLRGETVALLSALAQQSWERVGLHPKRGEFGIAAHAVMHVAHDANHVDRLRVLRERAG
ncbi:MAG: DinB family protein [Zetaproteobacteria bacterium]|nr:MAG: DinB family protein [Zetaproteobacteria bacterium]